MVSVLTRTFGIENLELAEDVVQESLLHAYEVWPLQGIPENPSAWLYRVAKNKAVDVLRRKSHSAPFPIDGDESLPFGDAATDSGLTEDWWREELVKDDMLRMMFVCCHPAVPEENQIALILKTLCGFSTAEIARAFLASEDTISKRLYRTKEIFRRSRIEFTLPSLDAIHERTSAVLNSIYLLFNEGYNSTDSDDLIRKDLMNEALLLCKMLTESAPTQLPETYALMALMCFQSSRTDSRLSPEGEIILLPDQDRSKWNFDLIALGNQFMEKAAFGDSASKYHLEAAIAFEHSTAPSFEQTNWKRIVELYDWLLSVAPSPIAELNRAVALMELEGPGAALTALQRITDRTKLEGFYLYHSLLGEMNARLARADEARNQFRLAQDLTKSETEKALLNEKIHQLDGGKTKDASAKSPVTPVPKQANSAPR